MLTIVSGLQVVKLYMAGRKSWTVGVEYAYRADAHELRMFFDTPRPWEINSVSLGTAEFTLVVERLIILFLYRFAPAIP